MACVRNKFQMCEGRDSGGWNCSMYPKRHVSGDYLAIAAGQIDFVSAEESWDNDWTKGVDLAELPADRTPAHARVATMFREPSSRVVSNFLYNYVQNEHRLPESRQGTTLSDVINDPVGASGANLMARKSLPLKFFRELGKVTAPTFSQNLRDRVRVHLMNSFEHIGIMEEYDLSMCVWLAQFAPEKVAKHCSHENLNSICPRVNSLRDDVRNSPRVRMLPQSTVA